MSFALVLRVIYVFEVRQSPLFDAPQMDALYHDQWAQAVARGEAFIKGPYFRAPLYPLFLGLIYKVFGHSYLIPRLVQSVLGSLSCGLVFLIGNRLFNRNVGALAGLAAATYWILIHFDAELLIAPLKVFLNLLLIWLLVRAMQRPGRLAYGLAGLGLGLSAIARPNVLLFAPAVVGWLAVLYRPAWRRAASYAACFALGSLLPVLPVTVRNYMVSKDLVLIASQGGVNFYIGNNPASDGITAIVPGTPGDWWGGYYATIARAEKAAGHPLKPSQVSRYYFRQSLDFFRAQPGKALALLGRKLWLFWNRYEISNNQSIYYFTEHFTPVVRLLPLGFGVVAPLGLLGLVLCRRRAGELFPLWGFVLVWMVSIVLFFCTARYRTPILGPLLVLAAHAVLSLIQAVRQVRWRVLGRYAAVLAPAALFVNAVPALDRPAEDPHALWMLAYAYRQQGRLDLALEYYRGAVQGAPQSLCLRYELGATLAQAGRTAEAVAQFQTALANTDHLLLGETMADVAKVHYDLAGALTQLGERRDAVAHYRQALQLDPGGGEVVAYYNLGTLLAGLGQVGDAVEAFQAALARKPDYPDAEYNLALVLTKAGQWDDAIVHYREAVRLNPRDTQAGTKLSQALVHQGRSAEAAEALDTLAAALAEAGQLPQAAGVTRQALEQARAAGDADRVRTLTARLQSYETGGSSPAPRP